MRAQFGLYSVSFLVYSLIAWDYSNNNRDAIKQSMIYTTLFLPSLTRHLHLGFYTNWVFVEIHWKTVLLFWKKLLWRWTGTSLCADRLTQSFPFLQGKKNAIPGSSWSVVWQSVQSLLVTHCDLLVQSSAKPKTMTAMCRSKQTSVIQI